MDIEHNIDYKRRGYLNKINDKRLSALASQDALKYYKLCNFLGMEPEDNYLYEKGLTDKIINDN